MAFRSPLASPLRGSGFRNLTSYRSRGRGSANPWTPAQLGLYAWGDVHIGGTSTTIADSSGHARAAASLAAGANAPVYLAYTGTAYTHLEAAGTGTNSISCTAPASTASYSAHPLGGGAPTTGAAASGAFAFTTAGNWEYISLLDGGAAEVARYQSVSSTQTGHTDSYGIAWTVNRGTAGPRTVVLGPAANSTRSLLSLGTNDFLTCPNAWIPPATVGTSCTVFVVARTFANPPSGASFFTTRATNTAVPGLEIRRNGTAASIQAFAGMTGTLDSNANVVAAAFNQAHVIGIITDSTNYRGFVNSTLGGTEARTGGDETGTGVITVGARPTPTAFNDMELIAVGTADFALSAAQLTQLAVFYGGGA